MTKLLEEIMKLSREERIQIAEAILETVSLDEEHAYLSLADQTMLQDRLNAARLNPREGYSWEEVKQMVRAKK
jgi:putative addiction module component (TIGR02574 family)